MIAMGGAGRAAAVLGLSVCVGGVEFFKKTSSGIGLLMRATESEVAMAGPGGQGLDVERSMQGLLLSPGRLGPGRLQLEGGLFECPDDGRSDKADIDA